MPTDAAASAREPLSRERVIRAAAALADDEGLRGVTMRRLATDLGVEAMSLYHHVRGKEDVLDGLVEFVVQEVRDENDRSAAAGGDWRTAVRRRCLAARTVMLRRPWAPGLIRGRSAVPPSVFGLFEDVLGLMVRGGCSYRLGHRAMHALGSMILGFTQELFSPADDGGALVDPDESEAALEAMAATLPYTTAMVASEVHAADDPMLGWCDSQTEFEFTLDLMLDGLERARLTETGSAAAPGTPAQ